MKIILNILKILSKNPRDFLNYFGVYLPKHQRRCHRRCHRRCL